MKSAMAMGGALTPSTAYLYDWNLLPLGQLLWNPEGDAERRLRQVEVTWIEPSSG